MKIVSGKSEHNASAGKHSASKQPAKSGAAPAKKSAAKGQGAKNNRPPASGGKKAIIIVCVVLAVLIAAFAGIGIYAGSIETVFQNISMEGVDVGGMTQAEAADALTLSGVGAQADETLVVSLPAGCEMTVSKKAAGCYMTSADAAVFAYDYCHGNGFFGNTFAFIQSVFGGKKLTMANGAKLNEQYLHEQVTRAVQVVSLALMDNDIQITDSSINVVKGADSVTVDADSLYEAVRQALLDGKDTLEYTATTVGKSTGQIDLQEIYDTVYSEPVNASIDSETGEIVEGKDGVSFDIENARRLWSEASDGQTVEIPLIKTAPEITAETLRGTMFSELLSQKSTTLGGSSAARVNNITRAAAAIDGKVLNPGEEFSYNGTVGQRTTAGGYQAAGAYSGGRVVSEVGGGICQVSSTLYYCALMANLEITERSCHYFGVSYLPAGLDATVSWPAPDFKFKNSSDYPIKIAAYIDKGSYSVAVQIWGYNPEGIRVEMTTASFTTANGFGATSYRTVYDRNGNVISKEKEASSEYHYHTEDNSAPAASEPPEESTEPTESVEPTEPTEPTEPVTPPGETPPTEPTTPVEPPVDTTPPPTPIPPPPVESTAQPQTPPPDVYVPPDM